MSLNLYVCGFVMSIVSYCMNTIYSGTCHSPNPYQISDGDYIYILYEHPIVKYRPFLKFGVVYNDYNALSSLGKYAQANIDHWRSKTVGEILNIFEDAEEAGNTFISICSCTTPIADDRYCCSAGECSVDCLFCNGTCIGSSDYNAGFDCNTDDMIDKLVTYYSNLNNVTHASLHITRRGTKLPSGTKLSGGTKCPNTPELPDRRKQPPRKCKKKKCYDEDSSESANTSTKNRLQYPCNLQDNKITDRSQRSGCLRWCTPKMCKCVYERQYFDSKYYSYSDRYRCVSS